MRFVVSYDVTEDRSRTKIAKLLIGVLNRVQYSVFEGEADERELTAVVERALSYLDPENDSLRVYRLCAACARQVTQYGREVEVEGSAVTVL